MERTPAVELEPASRSANRASRIICGLQTALTHQRLTALGAGDGGEDIGMGGGASGLAEGPKLSVRTGDQRLGLRALWKNEGFEGRFFLSARVE